MALSPQKASWRRVDTAPTPPDGVGAGVESPASKQRNSPLAGQGSSTSDFSLSPSTTSRASSLPSIAIFPLSVFPSPTGSSATSTPSSSIFVGSSQPLSDALSPTNTPLASSGSLSAVTTESFAAPVALDAIAPPSSAVQSTLQTPTPTDSIPSSPFGMSATSPSQLTAVVSDELPEPTRKPLSSNGLSLPSSANISPGIDDSSSPTSAPLIGQSPPVSFGGDTPVSGADSGFSDVPDVLSPVLQTLTGGQSQTIHAATRGGFVDSPVPNSEAIGPAPPTSTLSSGEIGIATITTPATAAITTTGVTSVPPSGFPSVSPIDLFADQSDDHPSDHSHSHHHHRFKKTSSFTAATRTVFYASTEISGTPTSILKTETIRTVLPTVLPVHVHKFPNRTVPVAVIVAPILSVAVIIALILAVLRRRWRLQHQRIQRRIHWPTFVGFSQVRETHRESVVRSIEEGPPYLPPLQSSVGWNDPPPGSFAFGEPVQDPFAPTPPMGLRPLSDVSAALSDRPLSVRTIRRVPVPDPFPSPRPVSTVVGSPEESNGLSQTSPHEVHHTHSPIKSNEVGWAV